MVTDALAHIIKFKRSVCCCQVHTGLVIGFIATRLVFRATVLNRDKRERENVGQLLRMRISQISRCFSGSASSWYYYACPSSSRFPFETECMSRINIFIQRYWQQAKQSKQSSESMTTWIFFKSHSGSSCVCLFVFVCCCWCCCWGGGGNSMIWDQSGYPIYFQHHDSPIVSAKNTSCKFEHIMLQIFNVKLKII